MDTAQGDHMAKTLEELRVELQERLSSQFPTLFPVGRERAFLEPREEVAEFESAAPGWAWGRASTDVLRLKNAKRRRIRKSLSM